jgi:hypothetical protein
LLAFVPVTLDLYRSVRRHLHWTLQNLVLCQPCSEVFRADLLPHGLAVGGGSGEAVPGDIDGGGA